LPSGLKAALLTVPARPRRVSNSLPLSASHTFAVDPHGRGEALAVDAEGNLVNGGRVAPQSQQFLPLSASHTFTVGPTGGREPISIRAEGTPLPSPSVPARSVVPYRSPRPTLPRLVRTAAREALAIRAEATLLTQFEWPRSVNNSLHSRIPQFYRFIITRSGEPPPIGLKAIREQSQNGRTVSAIPCRPPRPTPSRCVITGRGKVLAIGAESNSRTKPQ